jgi:hypothetical protein
VPWLKNKIEPNINIKSRTGISQYFFLSIKNSKNSLNNSKNFILIKIVF